VTIVDLRAFVKVASSTFPAANHKGGFFYIFNDLQFCCAALHRSRLGERSEAQAGIPSECAASPAIAG